MIAHIFCATTEPAAVAATGTQAFLAPANDAGGLLDPVPRKSRLGKLTAVITGLTSGTTATIKLYRYPDGDAIVKSSGSVNIEFMPGSTTDGSVTMELGDIPHVVRSGEALTPYIDLGIGAGATVYFILEGYVP